MKKIISILIFVFAGIIVSAQNDTEIVARPAYQIAAKDSDKVFSFAEEMPRFGDDDAAFMKYLQTNMKYPDAEKKAKKQGTVYVKFIVEKDGSVSNVRIVKSVADGADFDNEAIRVFSTMPNWKPGKMNGKPVRVEMVQPVTFRL